MREAAKSPLCLIDSEDSDVLEFLICLFGRIRLAPGVEFLLQEADLMPRHIAKCWPAIHALGHTL